MICVLKRAEDCEAGVCLINLGESSLGESCFPNMRGRGTWSQANLRIYHLISFTVVARSANGIRCGSVKSSLVILENSISAPSDGQSQRYMQDFASLPPQISLAKKYCQI
jgi:hypothetical protein